METDNSEKKIKSSGFSLKIKENKKKEVKKNTLFDAKNFRKPFEEDIVYNDDIKVKEELINEVEGRKIRPVNEIEDKGPLVIPLIKTNQWRNQEKVDIDNNNDNDNNNKRNNDKNENNEKSQTNKDEDKDRQNDEEEKIDLKNKYGLQIPVKKRKLNSEEKEEKVEITKTDDDNNKNNEIVEDNRTLEERAIDELKRESKMDLDNDSIHNSIDAIPILKQNAVPGTENFKSETEKFRYDIQFRPEESTLEDYERIPIEEFGAAMLRGMGWEKGKAVGRNRNNKNAMVEPIQFIPRPALLGLGAQPTPPDLEEMKKKRKRKGGREEPPKEEYKPHVGRDGKIRHFKTLDEPRNSSSRESSRHRDSSHHRHSSHRSRSRDRSRNRDRERDRDRGHDSDSDSSTSSYKKESNYTHSSSSKRKESPSSDTHSHSRDHSRHSSHSRSHSVSNKQSSSSHRREHERHDSNKSSSKQSSWLYPNIRVRIVSKSFESGKYYKKKGIIFDIVEQGKCTIRLDNGKLLENVKERYLETLIPEINEIIMVVRHTPYAEEDYIHKVGKVLSKDRNTEKAMIQLEPSMDVVMLSFDDICEFKGNTNDFY